MLTYNLSTIPFSLAGSFLIITPRTHSQTHRLLYKTSARRAVTEKSMSDWAADFFELALLRDGVEVAYTSTAQPHRLDLHAEGGGSLTLAFASGNTLTFETEGVTLRLLPCKEFATHYRPADDQHCLVDWPGRGIHHLRAGDETTIQLNPATTENPHGSVDFSGRRGALRFQEYEDFWQAPFPTLAKALNARQKEYARWAARLPSVAEKYRPTAEIAWFLLWNCIVPDDGQLTRPAIYMSKAWMNAIWSWDNCFNALAVARADPLLAWDQVLLFFDHQDPNGSIPDMAYDLDVLYSFNKPPIQGWAIKKLVERIGLEKSQPALAEIYKPLSRFTEWWYTYRDFDGDGMCQYHHGNDSGWDNATVFDQGYPTEGADLAAHLVLQCEGLAFIAEALGKKKAARRWQRRAQEQLRNLLSQGVQKDHFFAPLDGANQAVASQSLLNYIPLVLGERLPKEIRKALVADLQPDGNFLTRWGLASEATNSPKYTPDGYWRGPIWAPATYLIFDGLVNAGEKKLARTVAERFCDLCAQDNGFWENYDALSGKGLRCPGYSWTASVFLLLAEFLYD
jgi:hypothetical protein